MSVEPMLNRRMALEAVETAPDGAGGFVETPVVLGHLWVGVEARGGRLEAQDAMPLSAVAVRVTVRAAQPTSPQRPRAGQVLVEGTRRFRILAVSERGGDGRFLTCHALEEEVSA